MTASLQRITTEYCPEQDRLRLSGQPDQAAPVVVWLSRRLLSRLLPALLGWLERQDGGAQAPALLGYEQQAARAGLQPQAPVRALADDAAWLALTVELTMAPQRLTLTFQGGPGRSASLALEPTALRQWLGIVHDAERQADWALPVWPAWMRAPPPAAAAALLH